MKYLYSLAAMSSILCLLALYLTVVYSLCSLSLQLPTGWDSYQVLGYKASFVVLYFNRIVKTAERMENEGRFLRF